MSNIELVAKDIRKKIYQIAHHAGGGHMGSSFSMVDIISVLYFDNVLKYDAQNPEWENRDKFILSKGHACYTLYAVLAKAGYFSEEELWHVGRIGSKFGGHPKMKEIPGIEASTGALGHGLSFAIGIAYSNKMDKKDNHVYVVLGDGEELYIGENAIHFESEYVAPLPGKYTISVNEYNRIIKILNVEDNLTFDLKLYSPVCNILSASKTTNSISFNSLGFSVLINSFADAFGDFSLN